MFRPLPVFIGLRYVQAKRRSRFISFISLTSMIGMALGVLAMILVLSVMNGFQQEMRTRILGLVPHAVLSKAQPLVDWQALAEQAQHQPGVVGVAPLTALDGMLSFRGAMQPVQVEGVLPAREAQVSSVAEHLLQGRLDDLKPGEDGIIVGELIARRFRLNLGDSITLIVPEPSESAAGITPRLQRFTLVGVFKVGAELDANLALIHIQDAAQLLRWQPSEVRGLRLKVADLYQAPQIAQKLAHTLGMQAEDWTHTQGGLFSAMKMEKTMIGLLLGLIVAVAAFNIVATLIMVVTDKRTDIAILRTLGATPAQIMMIFMVQGSLIGLIGASLGALLGVLGALNISTWVAALEHLLGQRVLSSDLYAVSSLPAQLQWSDVLLITSLSFLLSFLATLYPAWRAAQTQPAESLRYE